MSKYLRKTAALKCPVHSAIKDKCISVLAVFGYFSKERILSELGLEAVEESVRWDYIAEFITAEGYDLVPLAARFFRTSKENKKEDMQIKKALVKKGDSKVPDMNLSRFLAGGHGRKTAGYASAYFANGRLALRVIEVNEKRRKTSENKDVSLMKKIAENAPDALPDESRKRLEEITETPIALN